MRVLLADDHAIVRRGLRSLVEEAGLSVVAEAADGLEAIRLTEEHRPDLIIVDVGHCFELYADFSRTGKSYSQFPDAQGFRVPLAGLRDPEVRALLRTVWNDPLSLDPSKRAAEVHLGGCGLIAYP